MRFNHLFLNLLIPALIIPVVLAGSSLDSGTSTTTAVGRVAAAIEGAGK